MNTTVLAAGPDFLDIVKNLIQYILWGGIALGVCGSVYLCGIGFFKHKSAIQGVAGVLAGVLVVVLFWNYSDIVSWGNNTEKNVNQKQTGGGTGVLHPKK